MTDYPKTVWKLGEDIRQALEADTAEGYQRLNAILSGLETLIQDDIRQVADAPLPGVIRKLKSGEPLTDEDREMIRWWMVADPRLQIQSPEDVNRLKEHLSAVLSRLGASAQNAGVAGYAALSGLTREAARIVAELSQIAQQRERVANFESSIGRLREEEREWLIRLLQQKVKGG